MAYREFQDKRTPVYTIVGGFMYDTSPDLGRALKRWTRRYIGENYAYFRLYETAVGGKTYRSAIYTKMPLCIFQFADEAVGIRYSPVVDDQIPSVSVWAGDDGCHFEYTAEISHVMKSKDAPHLGSWQRESVYRPRVSSLPELSVVRAGKWWQIVRRMVEAELADRHDIIETKRVQEALSMAGAFYDRMFDVVNGVHLETVYPDRPEPYGGAIFNHPSFEACRVASLCRLSNTNHTKCDRIARRLVFDETLSAELHEIGPYRIWHNCFDTLRGDSALYGCTTYGTGYSGYPGGMATLVRKLLEYGHSTGADDLFPRLKQGADWLLLVQREDGSFPFTVPTFAELGNPLEKSITGPESRALGGAAEAARALIWAFRVFDERAYLSAAEKAVQAINPAPPFYAFRGYGDLRDASEYETDASSGIQLTNANLELYEVTHRREYLETATILGYYVLTWHIWWRAPGIDPYGFIDPMAESFCPHVSPWATSLASELYSRLYAATDDSFWQKAAEFAFARAVSLQNPVTGGISEAYNLKMLDEITIMGGESAMTTWGLIDAGCAILNNRREPFACSEERAVSGKPVVAADVQVGALVVLVRARVPVIKWRRVLRRTKGWVRALVKTVFCIRGVSHLRSRSGRRVAPVPQSPAGGQERVLSFTAPGGCKEGMSFTASVGGTTMVLRLAALAHDRRIRKVYLPVLDFGSEIAAVEPVGKIGETITACAVRFIDGRRLRIRFLHGTTGLGVAAIQASGRRLMCDVSVKAGWQYGGECYQVLSLTTDEG